MTKDFRVPFTNVTGKHINDLPDHINQAITDLTALILRNALMAPEGKRIDPNISLSAMQKALALLIANFFPNEKVEEIAHKVAEALIANAILYSKDQFPV